MEISEGTAVTYCEGFGSNLIFSNPLFSFLTFVTSLDGVVSRRFSFGIKLVIFVEKSLVCKDLLMGLF